MKRLLLVLAATAALAVPAVAAAHPPIEQRDQVAFRTARVVMVDGAISRPGGMPHQHVGHVARRSGRPTRRSAASQNAVAHAAQKHRTAVEFRQGNEGTFQITSIVPGTKP